MFRVSHPPHIPRLQKTLPSPESSCKISLTEDELNQLNDQLKKVGHKFDNSVCHDHQF